MCAHAAVSNHRKAGTSVGRFTWVAVHDRWLRSWYQWFAPKARLEFADDSVDVVRDPRMQVR
jgi:hypothetical protein